MKSVAAVSLLSLVSSASAHRPHAARAVHHARQDPPVSGSQPSSFSISLKSTNPTAFPIASISGFQSSRATIALPSTAVPGSIPTVVAGAPALPARGVLDFSKYPTENEIPPIDSPEVQAWIDEVKNSNIPIPDLAPTIKGGCDANPAFRDDKSRCWWTCGGCVTADDIFECDEKNHWGLTFDDGPAPYTSDLLHYLDETKLKATFFVVGSRVLYGQDILQTQYAGGHQIAIHTWSHKHLTELTNEQIIAELGWTKKVIKDVLGVTPNMMRPPYGDIDNRVRAISLAMGLTPVMWTRAPDGTAFNTQDFDLRGVSQIETVLTNWQSTLSKAPTLNKGFITLQHDLFSEFVDLGTGYILPDGLAHDSPKFTIETVASCVNRPLENAYIETNNNATNPPKARLGVRTPSGTGAAAAATAGNGGVVVAALVGVAGFIGGLVF